MLNDDGDNVDEDDTNYLNDQDNDDNDNEENSQDNNSDGDTHDDDCHYNVGGDEEGGQLYYDGDAQHPACECE